MTGEWREATLGDMIELKRGYDLPQQKRVSGTIPIVSSSGISDYHNRAMAKGPGVVTGRYGTLGEVFYIAGDFWPLNTTLYVKDFKGNDPRFVSYFLRTLPFLAYSDKAAVPGLNRNDLHLAPVRYPEDVTEQRAIADVLGTLDGKIKLNQEKNDVLEAIARTIFKSWFVDFRPVHAKVEGRDPGLPEPLAELFPNSFDESELGNIPSGWEVRSLDDIARFLNGLALQKFPPKDGRFLPVIKIAQLRAGNTDGADKASAELGAEYVVTDGDVLFSWSGSLECVLWTGGTGALNQHLFRVTSAQFPKWLYYLWINQHLPEFRRIAAAKATTMGHIQRHHLSEAKIVLPSVALMNAADSYIAPLLDAIVTTRIQSRTLASLRDVLLPKLVSGEIQVENASRIVGVDR